MCGIAGIVDYSASGGMEETLRGMIGIMRHRGPDSAGMFMNGPVGLGHARLSIIDLSGGDQPIHNEDRSVWVIFNGEIFNYPELSEKLLALGHRFYTKSDTEVIVHLYEERGADLFEDLNGQFAIALWDQNRKRLLLGRDRMGIRPLYYHMRGNRLVFGSEIKAVFMDREVPRNIDPQGLSDIFTCWSTLGEDSPFQDVKQLRPGHLALFSEKGIETRRYWEIPYGKTEDHPDLEEKTDELNRLLHDAIRIRLRADVPVGAYLSGGLDSTYISSMIKTNFNNLLNTFSVSFTDGRFDESQYQEKAVEALGTDHRVIRCSEKDIGEIFPKVVWHSETPTLRTGPAPLMRLSKLVRDYNFKVVLTGEGADEVFAGYNIFKEDRVRRFWSRDPNSEMRPRLLEKLYPYIFANGDKSSRAFLKGFFKKGLEEVDSPVYSHMLRWRNTSQAKNFLADDFRNEKFGLDRFVEKFVPMLPSGFESWDPLSRAQYIESAIFLPNYLLSTQGDRMGMANSVEGRFPFLDHRVVEFACRLPATFKLNGLTEKYILKRAAKDLIPKELAERSKQPYRAPISRCFMSDEAPDYVNEMLSESAIKTTGYFHPKKVANLVSKCRRENGRLTSERENMALVGILSTQLADHMFVRNFPAYPLELPENVSVLERGAN